MTDFSIDNDDELVREVFENKTFSEEFYKENYPDFQMKSFD